MEFPSHYVNPRLKTDSPKWMLGMAKAIWNEFNQATKNSFNRGATRYAKNKRYSLGKQDTSVYKPMFEISEDENSSFINLDFSPPAIIPKFKRIVMNKFGKIDFTVTANAIDPYAMEDRQSYEAEERANIKTRGLLQDLGLPEDVLNSGELDQPKDEEELAIKMEFGYKHNMAIDIEKRIDAIFNQERLPDQLSSIRDLLWDTGVAGFKSFTDVKTGKVGFRYIAPEQLVISPTKDPFCRDVWYAGETVFMTIEEIRREAPDIDEKDLVKIHEKYKSSHITTSNFLDKTAYSYDSTKVPVLDFEVLSYDSYKYEKRKDKRGNPVLGRTSSESDKSGREYMDDDKKCVYRGKWVLETDVLFNYGPKSDVVRKASSLWDTKLSYIIVAPELNQMETSPIVENIIPIVDQIVIAWYKLQNVIAKARPKGILIEIGALEDISMGDGGEGKMTPLQILDMFTQTGTLVYRRMNLGGEPTNYRPIEELNNGLGEEAGQYFNVISNYMSMIREMIGFNDLTDGSTPDPKTLNGVAAHAVEATNNAIHHLLNAERFLIERLADDIAVRVHDSITLKKNSIYRNILGPQTVKSLKEDKNHIHREYGIVIEYNADPAEKQQLDRDIEIALQSGQITINDKYAVKSVRNRKQAEQLLAYRVKKNLENQAKQKEQDAMVNAKASAMAAQAAEEEKRKTFALQDELDANKQKREFEIKSQLLQLEYDLKLRNELPTQQTKKEVEGIRSDAQKETAKIKKEGIAMP